MTEPRYLTQFRRAQQSQLVELIVDDAAGAPKTLVERAVALKREAARQARKEEDDNLTYDQVWCVFDVDDHPRLNEARLQAEANGIYLAISNPCIELWGILHFEDHTAHIDRGQARALCKRLMPGYDKELPFEKLAPLYSEAVRRCSALVKRNAELGEPRRNPSTHFHLLTEQIRSLGKEEQLRLVSKKKP